MSTQRDDFNPLRPYHSPRPVGLSSSEGRNATTAVGGNGRGQATSSPSPSSRAGLGSSTRDILSDLDYTDYLSDASPSAAEMLRGLLDQAMWKYTSILLAQPFEVAKTVLQVQLASAVDEQKRKNEKTHPQTRKGSRRQVDSDDSGDDSASYFTSAGPLSPRTPTARRMQRPFISRSPSPEEPVTPSRLTRRPSKSAQAVHTVALTSSSSLTAVVSYLWQTEGAWGVWKGTNSTFIHSVLLSSFTTFFRSVLCAFFALPDPSSSPSSSMPGGLDILSSPSPLLSLFATTTASALAAVLLAPVDIVRTRLMLTPSTHPPRSLLPALRSLGTWTLPSSLAPATVLHSALPVFIAASTPLFCRARLGIDPILSPTAYSVATFASQAFELAVRLPVETVLRRGQVAFAVDQDAKASKAAAARAKQQRQHQQPAVSGLIEGSGITGKATSLETVVPVGPYRGLVGTMYAISFEEGERHSKADKAREGIARATGTKTDATVRAQQQGPAARRKKGQGVEGLYRGWRVGAWGLLGVWGAAMMGGGKGGEF